MKKNTLLLVLILLGVAASLVAVYSRHKIEDRNRRVETVVDYTDALDLSIAARLPFPKVLAALKRSGVCSLAIAEELIDSLRTMGAMRVNAVGPNLTELTFNATFPFQQERVVSALANKTKVLVKPVGKDTLDVYTPYNEISGLGAGLNPVEVNTALTAGFYICPRLYNYSGANPTSILWMLQRAKTLCTKTRKDGTQIPMATTVIFNGADVLGNRAQIQATADAFKATGLNYGTVEFGKQNGDDDLSRAALDSLVRVHAIGGSEMPTMDEPTAVGRYILGARERNIRVIYIRLFQQGLDKDPTVSKDELPLELQSLPAPLGGNLKYIAQVREGLREGGLEIGPAHPYLVDPLASHGIVRLILLALMGAGAAASAVKLLRYVTAIDGKAFWVVFILSIAAGVVLAIPRHANIGREALALLAAMMLPSIGLVKLRVPVVEPGRYSLFWALEMAFRRYVAATSWTVLGIILVIGLLAERIFMLHVNQFVGIRVAVIFPALATLLFHGLGLADVPKKATWAERKLAIKQRLDMIGSSPLLIGQTVFGMVAIVVFGIVVLRSGNDPGVGVSGTELSIRSLLAKVLFVRPRSKEFGFGHPAMIFGLAWAYAGNRKWLTLFLACGAIAQASLLNTFCHIHTPLLVSFIRAMLGWLIGAVIGAALFALLRRWIGPSVAATAADLTPGPSPERSLGLGGRGEPEGGDGAAAASA